MKVLAKVARYFGKPQTAEEGESASRLVKVIDETADGGYRMEWKGDPTEGIIYTLGSMTRQLVEYRTDIITKGSLTDKQKRNLGYLASDILIWSLFSFAASGVFKFALDDEDRKDPVVQLIYKRWLSGAQDVFVPMTILDMVAGRGSMMVSISVLKKSLEDAARVGVVGSQVLVDPDVTGEQLTEATGRLLKDSFGPAKTVFVVIEAMSDN
jgi:hypothetical protein